MKRKDFYQLVAPLSEKLYRHAYTLIPDDLQAEQLVVDGLNAYLLRERKKILLKEVNLEDKKEVTLLRRFHFKGILRNMCDIGIRRSVHFLEQMKDMRPHEYHSFYSLEPKVRFTMSLRFDAKFTVEEIEDIIQLPRYEVIEKLHNGRFLLATDLNHGSSL
jgi:hypothetical protein